MREHRKEIYIGESLRRLLAGRGESLTTVVNLIAERYLGLLERHELYPHAGCTVQEDDVYRAVIAENRGPIDSRAIALFPQAVADWVARHPEHHAGPAAAARVRDASFADLLYLVDRLERVS